MFFPVKELELRKKHFEVVLEPGAIGFLDPKVRQAGPIEASGVVELLSHTLGEIRVTGRMRAPVEADCDRCLEPVALTLDLPLDLFYKPAEQSGSEEEIDEGEAEIAYYGGDGLELNDVLREQVLLALPAKLVCRDECKGICPSCGQNRNQQECHCQRRPVDDRWGALKNL